MLQTPYDAMARDIFARSPASLQRALMAGTDRGIRDGIEHVGAPRIPDEIALLILGNGAIRTSVLSKALRGTHVGALALSPQLPLRASDWDTYRQSFPAPAGAAMLGSPGLGNPGGAGNVREVRRHPYTLFGQTTLVAGPGKVTNASPATFTNPTQYDFVITHVTLSQDVEPLKLSPTYKLQIAPAAGIPWTPSNLRVDASAMLSNLAPNAIPSTNSLCSSRWLFEGSSWTMGSSQTILVSAANPSSEAITACVLLYGTVRNSIGSPRLFSDILSLSGNAAETPFNSGNYQNAGDAPVEMKEIHVASATGNWGTTNPSAPLVNIRPNEDREFMNGPTLATSLNTTPGSLGGFFRLLQPQRITRGTAITTAFEETTGSGVIANVGFVGYLEIPA